MDSGFALRLEQNEAYLDLPQANFGFWAKNTEAREGGERAE